MHNVPEEYAGRASPSLSFAVVGGSPGAPCNCGPLLPIGGPTHALLLKRGDRTARERYPPRIADGTLTAACGCSTLVCSGVAAERGRSGWALQGRLTLAARRGAGAELILGNGGTPAGPGSSPVSPPLDSAAADVTCGRVLGRDPLWRWWIPGVARRRGGRRARGGQWRHRRARRTAEG